VLKEKQHLRKCLTKCRHCHILFLTHPRNAARKDLGCPFGCREAHRRDSAIKRSIEYYKSPEGKIKKQYLNARRNNPLAEGSQDETPIDSCETGVDPSTVLHIELTTSLIEGRVVGLKEVIEMIERILRQHSIDKGKKVPYRGDRDHTNPP
jgi:hypothetical protein